MRPSPTGQLSILNTHNDDKSQRLPFIYTLRAGASSWTKDNVSSRRGVAFTSSPSSLSSSPIPSNSIFPPLPQFLLIIVTAFTLAEILNHFGFFHDENGNNAKQKTRDYIESKQNSSSTKYISILEDIPEMFDNWFQREFNQNGGIFHFPTWKRRIEILLNTGIEFLMNDKQNNGDNAIHVDLAHKHQFAIGNVVGMISHGSPIMNIKVIAFTYVLSELIHGFVSSGPVYYEYVLQHLQENDDIYPDELVDQLRFLKTKLMQPLKFCDDKLRWFRIKIRLLFRSPVKGFQELLSSPWIESNGAIIAGFICGIIIDNTFKLSK